MSLSREKAEQNGLRFSIDGEAHPADPDIEIYVADLTIDGHTETISGKSEEDVLQAAERILLARGRDLDASPEEDDSGDEVETPDSDLHDSRNANDDPVA